jgi:adenosylmethionine-8-amino-7-oxononanoate aminotransferase
VLRLYTEGGILANGQRVSPRFAEKLKAMSAHPLVGDVRVRGLLAGVELVTDKARRLKPSPDLKVSEHVARIGYENGLIFRAFPDDIVGFAPPLCCTDEDIDLLIARFQKTLDNALALPEIRAAVA